MRRRTLAAPFVRAGTGIHSGASARAEVRPTSFGDGLVFRLGERLVPATIDHVVGGAGATVLGDGVVAVGVVEHLLAALYASGVTDAEIAVDGPELPFLDGSALPWLDDVDGVGLVDGPDVEDVVVLRTLRVEAAGGVATFDPLPAAVPGDVAVVAVDVDYGPPPLPRGTAEIALTADDFRRDVAWARTFALGRDVDRLLAAGRGRGASYDNTVVYDETGVRNPGGERGADEGVRHKLLDAIGDLALLGAPLRGRFTVARGSHALHHAAIRALNA